MSLPKWLFRSNKYLFVTRLYGHNLDMVVATVVTKDRFLVIGYRDNRYLIGTSKYRY